MKTRSNNLVGRSDWPAITRYGTYLITYRWTKTCLPYFMLSLLLYQILPVCCTIFTSLQFVLLSLSGRRSVCHRTDGPPSSLRPGTQGSPFLSLSAYTWYLPHTPVLGRGQLTFLVTHGRYQRYLHSSALLNQSRRRPINDLTGDIGSARSII